MEDKKITKISFSTFFLILAIIVIIAMACYIYIEKTNSSKEIANLEANATNMKSTINDLQGKINSISDTINSNSSKENTTTATTSNNHDTVSNDSISFTDDQVKTTLSNFLELRSNANCSSLLETLAKKGKLNYDYSKDTYLNDGSILTTIKFSDYKNAMLNYVSEAEFENNWISTLNFKKSDSGYLIRLQGGGGLGVYTITSITKNNNLTYSAKTTCIVDNDESMKSNEDFTFTVKSYNGNCVIDSIN